ncbi:unnamed protein product, partial [Closterium sp. NIES-53]
LPVHLPLTLAPCLRMGGGGPTCLRPGVTCFSQFRFLTHCSLPPTCHPASAVCMQEDVGTAWLRPGVPSSFPVSHSLSHPPWYLHPAHMPPTSAVCVQEEVGPAWLRPGVPSSVLVVRAPRVPIASDWSIKIFDP